MKVEITKPNLSYYIKLDPEDPEEEQLLQDLLAGKSGICIEQEGLSQSQSLLSWPRNILPRFSVSRKHLSVFEVTLAPYEEVVKSYPDFPYDEYLRIKAANDKKDAREGCQFKIQNSQGGSTVIEVPIEPHFAGDYRLEYDGKYVTLFGKDKNYPLPNFYNAEDATVYYDEMVLVPCVAEVRNARPKILLITPTQIFVSLNEHK